MICFFLLTHICMHTYFWCLELIIFSFYFEKFCLEFLTPSQKFNRGNFEENNFLLTLKFFLSNLNVSSKFFSATRFTAEISKWEWEKVKKIQKLNWTFRNCKPKENWKWMRKRDEIEQEKICARDDTNIKA